MAAGKIRYAGWSTDFPEHVPLFAQGAHFTAVQCQANLFDNPSPMFALCEELNVACLNRGPLAMGLLTGKFTMASQLPSHDLRGEKSSPWLDYFKGGKPNPDLLQKLEAIQEILRSEGRTLTQGALAWLWARSEKNLPIPGFKTVAQMRENAGAMRFGPLSATQLTEIEVINSTGNQ